MIVKWFWNSHATMIKSLIHRPVRIYTIFPPSSYKHSQYIPQRNFGFLRFWKAFHGGFFCPARKMPKLPASHSRTFSLQLPLSLYLIRVCHHHHEQQQKQQHHHHHHHHQKWGKRASGLLYHTVSVLRLPSWLLGFKSKSGDCIQTISALVGLVIGNNMQGYQGHFTYLTYFFFSLAKLPKQRFTRAAGCWGPAFSLLFSVAFDRACASMDPSAAERIKSARKFFLFSRFFICRECRCGRMDEEGEFGCRGVVDGRREGCTCPSSPSLLFLFCKLELRLCVG